VSKVFPFNTQVEILGFKKTSFKVKLSTQAFYSSKSVSSGFKTT